MYDELLEKVFSHLYARYLVRYAVEYPEDYARVGAMLDAELLLQHKAIDIAGLPELSRSDVKRQVHDRLSAGHLAAEQDALFEQLCGAPPDLAEPLLDVLVLADSGVGWFDDGWLRRFSPQTSEAFRAGQLDAVDHADAVLEIVCEQVLVKLQRHTTKCLLQHAEAMTLQPGADAAAGGHPVVTAVHRVGLPWSPPGWVIWKWCGTNGVLRPETIYWLPQTCFLTSWGLVCCPPSGPVQRWAVNKLLRQLDCRGSELIGQLASVEAKMVIAHEAGHLDEEAAHAELWDRLRELSAPQPGVTGKEALPQRRLQWLRDALSELAAEARGWQRMASCVPLWGVLNSAHVAGDTDLFKPTATNDELWTDPTAVRWIISMAADISGEGAGRLTKVADEARSRLAACVDASLTERPRLVDDTFWWLAEQCNDARKAVMAAITT